ncbi:MAG: hypothetical protein J6P93_02020 [Alphaproteobacteria bacterium]|nr:hypothetical protein [Alphaproteobacteria bacterium]
MEEKTKNAIKQIAILGSFFLVGTIGMGALLNSERHQAEQAIQNIEHRQKWKGYLLGATFSAITIASTFKRENY